MEDFACFIFEVLKKRKLFKLSGTTNLVRYVLD